MWGDLSQPAALTVTQRMPDGGAEALGDELFVQVPPQGGHVAYVGAKVTNFEGCRLELRASLPSRLGLARSRREAAGRPHRRRRVRPV
ncbi:MAG: hypothetical protein IPJ65_26315 [Archangiaceae bacterium]|nr:hypothetical protein [Archangiaceae bacterium]